ncbi:hypothetical protein C5Y96_09900 [Blastopirellula marina]|uniref:Uncharacterized protein n=1 Tax=Blastopirellula marina TaxID=124 RepID=A0A2S8FLW9_9BACT|nr:MULTISPECIES: hypothetical protein [Pirellulaceae]PQO33163.1 hypothetical protein C5Y96_09900 [Blastopirellula marina]RCS52252.1 hypothetical protein DTL36_09910 [Bremerella cremea]
MALVVPSSGENLILAWALTDATPENLTLKLFKNDITTIDGDTVAGDFTEADFTDYAAKTLTRDGWNSITQDANNKSLATYSSTQSWTCGTTGNTIYGYFIVGASSGTLVWAEKFATSTVLSENVQLSVLPKFTLSSEN